MIATAAAVFPRLCIIRTCRPGIRHASSKTKPKPKNDDSGSKKKYSSTVILPKTTFPRRIADGEPRVALDESIRVSAKFDDLYTHLQTVRADRPEFILHDGPPYANGDLHVGHAVNKILKDITNRYKILKGFRVDYQPGWDCHGLPIELKALQRLKIKDGKKEPLRVRTEAEKVVEEYSGIQRDGFRRWGVVADWSSGKNTYFTRDRAYEAKQIELFWNLFKEKLIYRDLKPVYWSPSSQSSLAEAELEYNNNHKSTAVYAAFKLMKKPELIQLSSEEEKLPWYAVIWTTTPWSLPGNQAIAFNPNVSYVLAVSTSPEKPGVFLFAENFIDRCSELTGLQFKKKGFFPGGYLRSATYAHPLYESKECPFLPGDYVSAEKGSGLVHTAPAHGHDDYLLGLANKLDTSVCYVDEDGKFTPSAGFDLPGLDALTEGTSAVIYHLNSRGLLLHCDDEFVHSYPYDWRTKKPVILRASDQWFVDVEKLRDAAVEALGKVEFNPSNGMDYMKQQLQQRPYWCISRQRVWGVPIPVFYDETNKSLISKDSIEHIRTVIAEEGSGAWWNRDVPSLLPEPVRCSLGLLPDAAVRKGTDILDIWFESGTSWACVLGNKKVADLYLEGHDQYGAWFQTSLLTSVALRNIAPYKKIFVHGFALDEKGRKMSKSLGNVIHPDSVVQKYGADALRIWVAQFATGSTNILFGPKLVDSVVENIAKWRSIFSFMLGCLHGYNPATNSLPFEQLCLTDRYMLLKTHKFVSDIDQHYRNMEYNKVIIDFIAFVSVSVSAFYCTVIKDRLYCEPHNSVKRRSALTTLHYVLESLLLVIAPIAPYLTEEVNSYLESSNKTFGNFFADNVWKDATVSVQDETAVLRMFDVLEEIRNSVNQQFTGEHLLKLNLRFMLTPDVFQLLAPFCDEKASQEMADFFGVSMVHIEQWRNVNSLEDSRFDVSGEIKSNGITGRFGVSRINVEKRPCGRCRKFLLDKVEQDLCERCIGVIGDNWSV
ncbi:isoleucine--tRNA ligase, mitochondrial-like [Paramacrobiotus metropolitanus]|uniref:isoleucine--tRNA ligase, mitochondrial-like n=1 Tax=Paramacrobiotus metropolitanus TaxID=2943436 RepID=UPI0024462221|nr:isoleucine--tRNA ligase, mitochondrial-like [Paramacrobiotus metropolitanus]